MSTTVTSRDHGAVSHGPDLSRVVVALMRGVVYREDDERLFSALLSLSARVREHVAVMGLELMADEAEGYAFLRQRPQDDSDDPLPRLVQRRPLSYPVSLLLALLRRELAKLDATGGETRLIFGRDEIVELIRVFLPASANEARVLDRMHVHINKVVELGFLRPLRGQPDKLEVRRILKAYVDAQWLHSFDERLAEYAESLTGAATDDERPRS